MERIEDCISFLLGKAYQQINQDARRRLAPHGVTPVQYAVLKVLWERDARSAAEICEHLVLDTATITGVLDRLERNGLIERRPDPRDRRINRLHLTGAGAALQAPLDAEMDAMNAAVFARLSPGAGRQLRALLIELGRSGSIR